MAPPRPTATAVPAVQPYAGTPLGHMPHQGSASTLVKEVPLGGQSLLCTTAIVGIRR